MITENLTIRNKDISVKITEINQADLKFYAENPRVYSVLNSVDDDPSQETIEKHMCNLEHVKELKLSIESNGGLIDPLIVRGGDNIVLEGNSRLAAYRLLCKNDPIKWGMVKCKVLPSDIGEDSIFALLGQYHIIGRKDWEPFEQAHYLYRRRMQTKLPVEYMAQELGISKQYANKMISVVEFMIKHDDLNKRHWSYYEEYLKNSPIKKYRETNDEIDDTIAEAIKKESIKEASDIRKLGEVAKVGDSQSKKLMQKVSSGAISLYDAYEEMESSGKLDDVVKKLNAFKKMVNTNEFKTQIYSSEDTKNRAEYEIKKIIKRLEQLQEGLTK